MDSSNIEHMNDYSIRAIFSQLPLEEMCNMANINDRFADICLSIWRCDLRYTDMLNYGSCSFVPEYFVKKIAPYLKSFAAYISDYHALNVMTMNIQFPKLTALILDNSSEVNCTSVEFLKSFPELNWLGLTQPILWRHLFDILDIKKLTYLEVHRDEEEEDYDHLIGSVLICKGGVIKRMFSPIEVFPPLWLSEEHMTQCNNLQFLGIDTRPCDSILSDSDYQLMPLLPSLKALKIIGNKFCEARLLQLIHNCPHLERLYIDPSTLKEISFNMVHSKRISEGNETPITVYTGNYVSEDEIKEDQNVSIFEFNLN